MGEREQNPESGTRVLQVAVGRFGDLRRMNVRLPSDAKQGRESNHVVDRLTADGDSLSV